MKPPSITAVYILHQAYGLESLRRFVAAYTSLEAGVWHRLVICCKGFATRELPASFQSILDLVDHRRQFVDDVGYDLGTYARVAASVDTEFVCFLNSESEPLVSGWLRLLADAAAGGRIGAAGATGSWESRLHNTLERWRTYPYRSRSEYVARTAWYALLASRAALDYRPFPNQHLRTNAFVMRRRIFLGIARSAFRTKNSTLVFESGRRSLTTRLLDQGLVPVIVGADGNRYEPNEWPSAFTFRRGTQHNLIVADKQTRAYDWASPENRNRLEALAWGRLDESATGKQHAAPPV